jgi:hypothetical protein
MALEEGNKVPKNTQEGQLLTMLVGQNGVIPSGAYAVLKKASIMSWIWEDEGRLTNDENGWIQEGLGSSYKAFRGRSS